MPTELQITLPPEHAHSEQAIREAVAHTLKIGQEKLNHVQVVKRSIDARGKVRFLLKIHAYLDEAVPPTQHYRVEYPNVKNAAHVLIVGAGPAGLFAALKLIERGIKPIILERGKDVRARRRDLALIHKEHTVNPDSNYCFGEGGAGTYSDGKLYTRSGKRGSVNDILKILVAHGAPTDILVDAHPHIGTNKLPQLITSIRETILNAGGELHFNTRVTEFLTEGNAFAGVKTAANHTWKAKSVILATGHSARDIFTLLHRQNILIEAKPFAIGIRIEHPQSLIDQVQYRCNDRGEHLPAASYSMAHQANGRGVYSFCMCPGGIIAPCATQQEEIVTNGWSPSKRNNPYANSGIVVAYELDDMKAYAKAGPLMGVELQKEVERKAWIAGGKRQSAPAQRMEDFLNKKLSTTLPDCSYQPGLVSTELRDVLPHHVHSRLREGLQEFGKKMRRYRTNEAVLVGVESRTSSPVRIPRDKETLEHPQLKGLYPSGEGAGYAGGIVSAAIDGQRCAEACAKGLH